MRVESRSGLAKLDLRSVAAGLALALATACSPIGTAIGVAATVADMSMQERGLVKATEDDIAWVDINRRLLARSAALAQAVHIQVQEGRVLLTGRVDRPEDRLDALRAAWGAPWVRSVKSEIQIAGGRGLADVVKDEWLIGRLRAKLFFDREIRANNYSIECIGGTVYLVGVAQDKDELQRAIDHARDIPYVRAVVTEIRLKDDPLLPPEAPPSFSSPDGDAVAQGGAGGSLQP